MLIINSSPFQSMLLQQNTASRRGDTDSHCTFPPVTQHLKWMQMHRVPRGHSPQPNPCNCCWHSAPVPAGSQDTGEQKTGPCVCAGLRGRAGICISIPCLCTAPFVGHFQEGKQQTASNACEASSPGRGYGFVQM